MEEINFNFCLNKIKMYVILNEEGEIILVCF